MNMKTNMDITESSVTMLLVLKSGNEFVAIAV